MLIETHPATPDSVTTPGHLAKPFPEMAEKLIEAFGSKLQREAANCANEAATALAVGLASILVSEKRPTIDTGEIKSRLLAALRPVVAEILSVKEG